MSITDFINQLAEELELENASNLTAETKFRDLDEWNSLAHLGLISFLDDQFDIQIENSDLKQLYTLGDLFNYVENHK